MVKLHKKNSSQVCALTGISGSGNVIRTHDTSGMKKSKLEIKDMDDRAGVGWLRTEDLCGFSAFMNTVNSQKFQLFGNPESFKAKFIPAKSTYSLIKKAMCKKRTLLFSVWQLLEVSEESVTDSKKFPLPFKDSF